MRGSPPYPAAPNPTASPAPRRGGGFGFAPRHWRLRDGRRSMRRPLPRDVGLAENLELLAFEDGGGAFVVLDVEGEGGAAAGAGE